VAIGSSYDLLSIRQSPHSVIGHGRGHRTQSSRRGGDVRGQGRTGGVDAGVSQEGSDEAQVMSVNVVVWS